MLTLIDLDQKRRGYRRFISTWVFRQGEQTVLVDPGPSSTIPKLVSELSKLGGPRVGTILLTHVHLDHAGGVGDLLKHYPSAKVFVAEQGARHLIDPTRLWQGSLRVLGDVAKLYGKPLPIASASLMGEDELQELGIQVIPTPGHAVHHVSFVWNQVLFAGEVFGTTLNLASGRPYLRPATPARFFPEIAKASIQKVAELSPDLKIAFAHHGLGEDPQHWAGLALTQLELWVRLAQESTSFKVFYQQVMEQDPLCGSSLKYELDQDLQEREEAFALNSYKGIVSSFVR